MEEMLPAILKSIGKKGNVNNTVLAVGAVGAIGLAGAGVAVSQFIKRGHDQASTQEEAKKAELGMEQLRRKFIYDNGNREWKIIDCASGKKCIVPEAQSTYTPTPLTDSTGKINVSGAAGVQKITVMVPVVGNLDESQVDTFFGTPSSAPPTQIDSQTTPGILNSRVIFSLDTATPPQIGKPGELIIQTVVTKADNSEVPGPSGKVELAALPTPPAPTCTVSASRTGTTSSCTVTVTPSGTYSGSPSIPGVSLSASGTDWTSSSATCAQNASTTFTATITGPGGTTTCNSAAIGAIAAPTCTVAAARTGTSSSCTVTVIPSGVSSGSPSIPGVTLSASGTNWTSTSATCDTNSSTTFTATITGPGGTNTCNSPAVGPIPPTCTVSAARNSDNITCNLTLSTSGTLNSPPSAPTIRRTSDGVNFTALSPSSPLWTGSTYTGTVDCLGYQNLTFRASVEGPGGTSPACQSPPVSSVPAPTCSLDVTRVGTTSDCTVKVIGLSGTITSASVSPTTPLTQTGSQWVGTATCGRTAASIFQASVTGPGSATAVSCGSKTVDALVCYSDASGGNEVDVYSKSGKNYRYHRFTSSGSLTVNNNCSPFQYLIVAGGGGGGNRGHASGGGGAGGLLYNSSATFGATGNFSVTVGAGGAAQASGSNSVLSGPGITTLTAIGGGRGGNGAQEDVSYGAAGGSGGGTGGRNGVSAVGGAGTTGQGYAGGAKRTGNWDAGGGGGGAGGAGHGGTGDGLTGEGGAGGPGRTISITGTDVVYAGGGGGSGEHVDGAGGSGGGGAADGGAGAANRGGGGGGGNGPGGSGVVIVAYELDLCSVGENLYKDCPITRGQGRQTKTCNSPGLWGTWGTCQVTSCQSGYSISGNSCAVQICTPNTTASQSCTVANASSATQSRTCAANGLSWSSWSTCQATACNTDFTLTSGACTCTPGSKAYTTTGCTGGKTKSRTCNTAGTAYGAWSLCTVP